MVFNFAERLEERRALLWNYLFLVAMSAVGQIDYYHALLAYAIECVIALLLSVAFFSRTAKVAVVRLVEGFTAAVMTSFVLLAIWAVFHGTKTGEVDASLNSLEIPAIVAAIYCGLRFGSAWWSVHARSDRRLAFFAAAIYPANMPGLALTCFASAGAGALAYELVGADSVASHRIVATILTLLSALFREAFATAFADPKDLGKQYWK